MEFPRFIVLWIKDSLSAAVNWAQAALFITFITVSAVIYGAPEFAKTHELHTVLGTDASWQGGAIVLGAFALTRLIYAPYRLWSIERQGRIAAENAHGSAVKGRIIQSGSNYDVLPDDNFLIVKYSVSAVTNINLPKNPHENHRLEIKASMRNCITNQIFVNGNGNKIDGIDRFSIVFDFQSYAFTFLGGDWHIT